jgi:tetratricopeptide (TPR) repeat protein
MAKRAHTSAARSERGTARAAATAKPKLRLANKNPRAAVPGTPPAVPPRAVDYAVFAGPSPEALAGFAVGVNALQRHDYKAAAGRFRSLLSDFPQERSLLDRVRLYLAVCERELRRAPTPPGTVEERLTLATAALNNGDERTAARLAQDVLTESPDHDLALYLVAAVHARQGDAATALRHLRHALEVSPDVQAQARHDSDFDLLKDHEEFRRLLELPAASDRSPSRRARRTRADR